jgi:translation initiation factor IF-3
LRINKEIRAAKVRVIDKNGNQLGVLDITDALQRAVEAGLDLLEISASADPPVCKITDYGKYQYQQTKKERANKKAQHQIKIKEVKIKPNIDEHDILTKLRHAREFVEKGNKVKITCTYRGREIAHQSVGKKVVDRMCSDLSDIASIEAPAKMLGRVLTVMLAPGLQKGSKKPVKAKEKIVEKEKSVSG